MPLSPRTLRPSSSFTPKSISGLALWLDASATGDLYTTDAGPVTAVSSPTEISGCVGWWDASSLSGSTGSAIQTLTDSSGNGCTASASGASSNWPTLNAGGLNGRNTLVFDGVKSGLRGSFASSLTTYAHTTFVVCKLTAPSTQGSNARVFTVAATAGNDYDSGNVFPCATASTSNDALWQYPLGTSASYATGFANTWGIFAGTMSTNGVSVTNYKNGVGAVPVSSAATTQTVSVGRFGIGCDIANSSKVIAEIAEVIYFNTALSTADRARVEAYLAQRWGISGVHAAATSASDPVGYWRDRSGNGRHATQATGANRPRVNAAGMNASRSVQFSGGNSELLSLGNLSSVFPSAAEVIVAYEPLSDTSYGLYETSSNSSYFRNGNGLSYFGTFAQSRQNGISVSMPSSGRHVASIRCSSGGQQVVRLDGAQVFSGTPQGSGYLAGTSHVLGNNNNPAADTGLTGYITDVVAFPRILSGSERSRIEKWLAARRGITLAPQVSNADAQDWVNRVYANGGAVSTSTASAVNTLCDSLDASGVRPLMYRMGIFAGTGLNAALVPLYRGPSLGGTQYGNATDTNVGPFVSGDYVETGASGGLLGNGTSKYLNPGIAPFDLPVYTSAHMAVYHSQPSGTSQTRTWIGCEDTAAASAAYLSNGIFGTPAVFGLYMSNATANYNTGASQTGAVGGMRVLSRISPARIDNYYNAVSQANSTVDITGGLAGVSSTRTFFVFANNNKGTADKFMNGRIMAYSIGTGLSQSQVDSYNTAMQAFQAALGRNV